MTTMNESSNQSEKSEEFVVPNSTDKLEKLAKLLKSKGVISEQEVK